MNKELEQLLEGNKRYLNEASTADYSFKRRVEQKADGQHPIACVVTCSDSRVVPEKIFDASLGEIFVTRVIGNIIDKDELASIDYAVNHLGAKLVIILGHTECGAIKAAMYHKSSGYSRKIIRQIKKCIHSQSNELEADKVNALHWKKVLAKKFKNIEVEAMLYNIENGKVALL